MTETNKKILIAAIIGLVIVALIVVLWLYWPAITGTIRDEKYYTQDEMDNAVSDAYDQALGDRDNYLGQIDYYRTQLEITIENLTETSQQLNEALAENSSNTQLIEELNNTINSLTTQISTLQSQITELQLKLDAYAEYEGVAVYANFYVDGEPYDVDIVNKNTDYVSFPTGVIFEDCNFEGWSLDGETVIYEENYTIEEDTNFYAVLTCDVTFSVNGEQTTSKVLKNTTFSNLNPEVEEFEGYELEGFYIGNEKVEDDYVISCHTNFTAKFRHIFYGTIIEENFTYVVETNLMYSATILLDNINDMKDTLYIVEYVLLDNDTILSYDTLNHEDKMEDIVGIRASFSSFATAEGASFIFNFSSDVSVDSIKEIFLPMTICYHSSNLFTEVE